MSQTHNCLLVSLSLVLTSMQASADTPLPPRSLLLRVHDVVTEGFTGHVSEITTLIFRDGLVIEETLSEGRCSQVLRAVASSAALRSLNQALVQNRVGIQAGGCRIDNHLVGSFTRDTSITWFGARGRRNTLRVGDLVGTETCPTEAERIRNAIDDYVQHAVSDDPNAALTIPCG